MIEVGEYGRTNLGNIFIFAWLTDAEGKRYENKVILGNGKIIENRFYYFHENEKIVKHSKNIIDLIEEGDYVNGYKVDEVRISCFDSIIFINDFKQELHSNDIKSIVTKEQFESVS